MKNKLSIKSPVMVFSIVFVLSLSVSYSQAMDDLMMKDIDSVTKLISQGFPYRKDMGLDKDNIIKITKINGSVFVPDKESLIPISTQSVGMSFIGFAKGANFEPLCTRSSQTDTGMIYFPDAIGNTWIFTSPNMSFRVNNYNFISQIKGASIKFKKEGVLVTGFEIKKVK